ncbi:unnamed protein product [Effrenium voratum]|uniref:Exonuclease domain-containing protein n=1 Tax=Effrenium voratum TaxID=2562239 RepID=A0AA36J675_9DINO|nr:unnamed protein product [Effrenium voratum]
MGHGLSRGFRAAAVSLLAVAVVAWARRRRPVSGEASPAEATEAAPARDAIPSRPSRPPPRPKRLAEVFICLDFEWTCDDGERRRVHSDNVEILEFSYVIYDVAAERVVREGQHYCKNQRTPITKFCSELTGITDDTVASAGSLKDALQALQEDLNVEELRGRRGRSFFCSA